MKKGSADGSARTLRDRLRAQADPERAANLRRFFKTGPGQYGAGDRFLGLTVPLVRQAVQEHDGMPHQEILTLLRSPWHEERLAALLLLVRAYARGDNTGKPRIYRLYLANTSRINNWDLVDLSAPHIVGAHLLTRSRKPLYRLARSRDLWKRRIAVLACFAFIRQGEYDDALAVAELLLDDEHDLIHKAVGWMLREVGKRSLATEERFLKRHCPAMPRTMLRYAIERFPERKRQAYLRH